MFNFLKEKLTKVYAQFSSKVQSLFNRSTIDQSTLQELYELLIQADVGVKTTKTILSKLENELKQGTLQSGLDIRKQLEIYLTSLLLKKECHAPVILLVGINGSGKTTCAGKLAHFYRQQNKRVLLAAADTFRAAAVEQLESWADKTGASIIKGKEDQDPASVVYEACAQFKAEHFDYLIIDTAGRLQTKEPLMRQLSKIKRTIERQLPDTKICTLLTLDAMLGQNSFSQAKLFNEATAIDGILVTKLDGTGKGGIVFAIQQELGIPIAYLSLGEHLDQLKIFDPHEYITIFLGS